MWCVFNKVLLPKWPYGQWDHFMISSKQISYWEKRYQTNPQGGFTTFPDTIYHAIDLFLCKTWIIVYLLLSSYNKIKLVKSTSPIYPFLPPFPWWRNSAPWINMASCSGALRASAAARLCSTRARWASLSSISARFALTKKLWDSQLGSLQPKQMLGNDIECDRVGQDTQSDRKLIMPWRSTHDKQMCVFVPVFFV